MNSNHQSIIGITGGIGAGKSVVSRYLRLNGFPVYDCDYSAKRLMNSDESFKRDLTNELGGDILDNQGNINKPVLAEKIFGNDHNMQIVNKLVKELISKDIKKWIGEHPTDSQLFIESAILYSSELYKLCGSILLVSASQSTRIERVKLRNALPESEIIKRIETQNKEYISLPTETTKEIINEGNLRIINQLQSFIHVV